MADWARDDIARLLTLLERIAAALEGAPGHGRWARPHCFCRRPAAR